MVRPALFPQVFLFHALEEGCLRKGAVYDSPKQHFQISA
jgi:hypothetical protein